MKRRTPFLAYFTVCMMGTATLLQPASAADDALTSFDSAGAQDTATAAPAQIPTEIMRAIRAATFEVVVRKAEQDPLQYERPLPLDLLPFAERNDEYQSIGTAFAIDTGRFITAAHVAAAAVGSAWGAPALRDAQGNVHPIDQVTRFSMHEDFIVFSVSGAAGVTPLRTSTQFSIDTPVTAVGNALGQGIVARDGMLTSQTPEEQDGRWQWLRFSAPASPGNSGGPLLDMQGRVIGVIARKSPNENLNYALPIARVLQTSDGSGAIDTRLNVGLPLMPARVTTRITAGIDLPLSFGEFDRRITSIITKHTLDGQLELMRTSQAQMYPGGRSGMMLADHFVGPNPAFVALTPNGTWDVPRNVNLGTTTQFGDGGQSWVFGQAGATLFRLFYPADADVSATRDDSKLFGDQLLKGWSISRTVAGQRIRITSLGSASHSRGLKDRYGRVWREWRFPIPYADSVVIVHALPTPNGYVGFLRVTRQGGAEVLAAEMQLLMNFMQATYAGDLRQWRAFLADERLRPATFASWKAALDPASDIHIETARFAWKADRTLLTLSDESVLSAFPAVVLDNGVPAWDLAAIQVRSEPRDREGTRLLLYRRAKPVADQVVPEINARWESMTLQRNQFSGTTGIEGNTFWVRQMKGPEGAPLTQADFLYEMLYIAPRFVGREAVVQAGTVLGNMLDVLEK